MRAALIALPLGLLLVACQGDQSAKAPGAPEANAVLQTPSSSEEVAKVPVEDVEAPQVSEPETTKVEPPAEPAKPVAAAAPPAAPTPAPSAVTVATAPAIQPGVLPQGPGRNVAQRMCSTCHSLVLVTQVGHTEEEWDSIVARMENNGMMASPEDIDTVITYLGKALPPR